MTERQPDILETQEPAGEASSSAEENLAAFLDQSRRHLLAFIESKVGDPEWAEDILQTSVLKALRAAESLREEEKLVPWFYQIVRHAITDARRQKAREEKYRRKYEVESHDGEIREAMSPEEEAMICRCFRALLPALKDEYRVVIDEMELGNRDPEEMAQHLGITRNNLNVRRHRARRQLRRQLEALCSWCPEHGYDDCGCPPHLRRGNHSS
ncbi:RNA polymerase sigma-70 factor (ECF subfamily) [Salinibacter ruber]|jgi:RNA polymerase sigma-70 factor (ECF subfamily)|uniref:RNA polymerase sigma factor n=1 Tax=Salinibacter ruber TaxID=146919 RepID=A0A9X2PYL6_9BACT|nr:sigma-70 family RNA polymerase sigma factor [Salinibacter ruber]MCS3676301.1 RNA polymerase sigma-70 factor (ECF subfamily) [Salinibacter ruber]MCS3679588.1 RNA polymerase sigma-70 factor (ECF subfamily) [Salinibacter ruber]MCS3699201.1 RNA polymerase sigma-70 factor (ECF subfamily) [Salinibacter ruber]MCS4096955.1 RNA polymerase sigma-70 factor (ECF subfamily) [Salinibacter ruber]MCS4178648.1 RNA polymerase sigma-70 factor (ECF subfamily) [Salinibacter ruber]